MRQRFAVVFVFALLATLLPAGAALAQPPGNDDVADATLVTAIPYEDVVDVSEATIEEGEPVETCAPFANTVWYALQLEQTTDVLVDTAGSNYDTALAVWTGSGFGDATLVACVDDTFFGLQAAVTFTADAGTTYLVQAGAFGEAFPGATLQISFGEPSKPTGKPQIFKSSFRGNLAQASVFGEEPDSFSFTEAFLVEGRQKVHRERPFRFAELYFSSFEESFDPDTETFTTTQWFGFTPLEPAQYDFDSKLRHASVDAELTLSGQTCTYGPEEPFEDEAGNIGFEQSYVCIDLGEETVQAAVEWTGSGPTFKSTYSDRFSTEGIRSRFRVRSTSRDAMAAGSVAGENLFFDMSGAFGFLSKEAAGDMVVFRGGGFFPI